MKLRISALLILLLLPLSGCSDTDNKLEPDVANTGTFYVDSTELENEVARACEVYWFATGYFKLMVEKQASENEVFYMASEMRKASGHFQKAIEIDEAEGGYQYQRYINYRDLADKISNTPSQGLNWSFAAEDAHKDLLKWCANFNLEMQKIYKSAPDLDAEGASPENISRLP